MESIILLCGSVNLDDIKGVITETGAFRILVSKRDRVTGHVIGTDLISKAQLAKAIHESTAFQDINGNLIVEF
jgi:hypothetical protein